MKLPIKLIEDICDYIDMDRELEDLLDVYALTDEDAETLRQDHGNLELSKDAWDILDRYKTQHHIYTKVRQVYGYLSNLSGWGLR